MQHAIATCSGMWTLELQRTCHLCCCLAMAPNAKGGTLSASKSSACGGSSKLMAAMSFSKLSPTLCGTPRGDCQRLQCRPTLQQESQEQKAPCHRRYCLSIACCVLHALSDRDSCCRALPMQNKG